MALKAVLDQEGYDALGDALKAEYTQDGEHWYLDAEDIDAHPKVKGLKSAFEKKKREADSLRTQAEKWKDKDPDKYDELIAQAEKKEEQSALDKGEFDKLRERLVAQHTKDLEKKDGEIGKREKFIHKLLVDNELNAAIEKAGVKPEYRQAVKALMKEKQPTVIAEGDDYKGVFKTDLGELAISEFVATWSKSDEAAHYLPPSGKGGSGADASVRGKDSASTTFDRNDPLAWGQHAEKLVKGEARAQ